jgi:thiamine biosynthesis lipoprotein ApbE
VSTVTVISARATQAEVLAKAALAAGADGARHLLRDQGATGLVVTDDGTVVELDGFDTFRLDRRTVAAGGGA